MKGGREIDGVLSKCNNGVFVQSSVLFQCGHLSILRESRTQHARFVIN